MELIDYATNASEMKQMHQNAKMVIFENFKKNHIIGISVLLVCLLLLVLTLI